MISFEFRYSDFGFLISSLQDSDILYLFTQRLCTGLMIFRPFRAEADRLKSLSYFLFLRATSCSSWFNLFSFLPYKPNHTPLTFFYSAPSELKNIASTAYLTFLPSYLPTFLPYHLFTFHTFHTLQTFHTPSPSASSVPSSLLATRFGVVANLLFLRAPCPP